MNELVSIVIPVYNVEKYIVECLESVAQQDYSNLEVIIVDDCGSDNSIAIAEGFISSRNLDWTIIHHSQNKGLSGARNSGLKAARGSYVYFLDSDDKLEVSGIGKLVSELCGYPYDVVVGGYEVIGGDPVPGKLYISDGDYRDNESVIKAYSEGLWYVMAWNKLCRREFLLNSTLWFEEGVLHEDVIWSFKLATKAHSLRSVVVPTYSYRVRPDSIMTSFSIEKDAKSYAKAFELIYEYVVSEGKQPSSYEYTIFEGKKSTLLFSLLAKNESDLFRKFYRIMRDTIIAKPYDGYKSGIISRKQLIRDVHYSLPIWMGSLYKRLFYIMAYKLSNRQIEGAIWK